MRPEKLFPAFDFNVVRPKKIAFPSLDLSPLDGVENPLPWEDTSRAIYRAALRYRMMAEAGTVSPALERWRMAALGALAERDWRPFRQGQQSPDYNCWSNGYFPGAWGLLGGEVETFHEKGTFHIRRLPGAAHWLRRSTNHGIVILASYLLGAKALGQELVGRDMLREVIEGSCKEGCYPEGVNYLSFILSEIGPYLAAGWDGENWREHVKSELPGIEGAKRHFRLAMDNSGTIRNTFGDAKAGVRLFRHAVRVADSLSDEGDLAALLTSQFLDDRFADPIADGLPSGGRPAPTDYLFSNDIATAREDGWWLWVFGSRVHLTHNCDHDCGSFLFQKGDLYVGELPGREAWKHNVPLLKDAPGYPLCNGPDPFQKRQRSGQLQQIGAHSWRVSAPRSFDGCPTQIVRHLRDLHVVDGCLVVIDRVRTEGPGEPVVQFMTTELTSLFGFDVIDGRAHCRMSPTQRGWVSAAVIGANDKLTLDRGVTFRGRRFRFPP